MATVRTGTVNYFRQLKMAVLYPGNEAGSALDRNNRIAVFLFAILPGLSPNFNSFILLASMVWGAYCLATGSLALNLSRSDRLVAIGMSIYPLVMIASIFINPPYSEELDWIFRLLPFFSVWLILPRMRQSPDGSLVPLFILGAGIGMIVTFLFSLLQIMFLMERAEAGTSNAALLGVIGVLFGGIALLNVQSPRSVEQRIAILGYAAGLGCVLLSGTRSAWLVIPVHIVIFLWYFRKHSFHLSLRSLAITSSLLLAGLIALGSGQVLHRIEALQENLTSLERSDGEITSIGARFALYKGALSAISKDPLTGYGPQNRMASVLAELPENIRPQLPYSHVHNGFLTAGIDAGVFGIAALSLMLLTPVIGAWRKEAGPGRDLAIALALLLFSSYVITGSFGIMFNQKALDPIFAYLVALICADRGSTAFAPVVRS
ncbi:O-antigen ligase domain-containing protein [Rhizobium leguminosarum bv. viciae]|uniref:O-antigen ligase family protein n=1 Tax=Rhizobium ruizarguesonis TaxID=2081791 RepID=UPI00102F57EA|nr:O-antigen ligase family protein [Rhizobium ruizarguesonis]TCA34517.1 O-antigen ligase domain-containing protein [Rhizobium leguminosarum bv. viciae]TBC68537.1 O-antigen ligase domain-containing protein [Rhizobium ruizarguesonis]TBC71113.1 O-antigen ligase domain-containing protein [Rhizobium ruizarguesonis]TBE01428.1 O-antigen ligase domain-containing protein [Rhizobium ruizarguesonis]TBF01802.1 O-antigen ligase domain-containing protein [Rhizobium ruizarguesonis]